MGKGFWGKHPRKIHLRAACLSITEVSLIYDIMSVSGIQQSDSIIINNLCMYACVLSCSVVSDSLQPHGLQLTRLLCPWDFPGKNTGVGSNFLLQGTVPTQGWNPRLLQWQVDSLPLSHQGNPVTEIVFSCMYIQILLVPSNDFSYGVSLVTQW